MTYDIYGLLISAHLISYQQFKFPVLKTENRTAVKVIEKPLTASHFKSDCETVVRVISIFWLFETFAFCWGFFCQVLVWMTLHYSVVRVAAFSPQPRCRTHWRQRHLSVCSKRLLIGLRSYQLDGIRRALKSLLESGNCDHWVKSIRTSIFLQHEKTAPLNEMWSLPSACDLLPDWFMLARSTTEYRANQISIHSWNDI